MSNPFEPPATDVTAPPESLAEPEPITIRYDLQMATVAASLKHVLLRTPGGLVILLLGAGGLGLLFVSPIAGGFLLLLFGWVMVSIVRSAARPALGRPGETVPIAMTLSSGGVRLVVDEVTIARKWSEMSHYHEGKGVLSLCPDAKTAWPIMTEKLDPAELAGVRRWLAACLPATPRNQQAKRSPWRVLVLWMLLILIFWAIYQVISTPR